MNTKLLVFGDSWPAGAELLPEEKAFPELLKDILGIEVQNLSQQATSIDDAVYKFLNTITPENAKNYKILFCLTGYSRSLFFKNNTLHELHVQNKNIESISYYTHIYSTELGKFNLIKNILLIQEVCYKYNVPLFFIFNWSNIPNHPLINKNLFYSKSLMEILNMSNLDDDFAFPGQEANEYIKPNICHPNQSGHMLIAQALGEWIK